MVVFAGFFLEPWPAWAGRWYGRVIRALILGMGGIAGLFLILLAYFAASFKTSPPEWDAEAVSVLISGVATMVVSLLAAIRPTRGTVALLGLVLVWLFVLGGLL